MEQAGIEGRCAATERRMFYGHAVWRLEKDKRIYMKALVLGSIFVSVGLLLWYQNETIEKQQAILYDVACDNMALRFFIHKKEVEENA